MDKYLIYAIDGGWIGNNGVTMTSDWTRAQIFEWDDARKRCAQHRDHEGNFVWLPIPLSSLRAITLE